MQRVVIGTAGHIDHGKTRLLEALTGIDCDRWAEEKARGITIDLGFAHFEEGDLQVGFVDVPGHERFLHNALAGLGGIRVMLLVVAADEGVKPQTREHLAICSLLGIPNALVALTKRDLVDDDLLELAQLEVEEELESTPFGGAEVLPVSSVTGEGIDRLRETLVRLARRAGGIDTVGEPFRLPIDRAFQLRGLGAIITGTLSSGRVETGQSLSVLPREAAAKVRSVQVHGSERGHAEAGERTALQLAGVDLADLERGEQLVDTTAFGSTRSLVARFTLLADAPSEITTFTPIRFHLYSSEVLGKLRPLGGLLAPGEKGLVEIRLAQPVVAVRGDRFVVRRPSPPLTLGGGEILDPMWRRRRGRSLAQALPRLESETKALRLWVLEQAEQGATAEALASRLGQRPKAVAKILDGLVKEGHLLRVDARGRRWIAPDVCQRAIERGKGILQDFFAADRLALGMPKAQFIGQLLPKRATDLAEVYLRWLEAAEVVTVAGDLVNPPGREVALSGQESHLSRALLEEVAAEGLTPPPLNQLPAAEGVKRQIVEGVQRFLLGQGKLVRLPSGLVLARSAIDELADTLRGEAEKDPSWQEFGVPQFKDRFGLSRKWAIPLLEHLDSVGITRRVGDKRQLVRR